MTDFVDLDVRPILRAGGEPFAKIMETVRALAPGQGLRLFATFKPTPLLRVLGSQGFSGEAKELDGGDWQVDFTPAAGATDTGAGGGTSSPSPTPAGAPETPAGLAGDTWPAPAREMDNRPLDPPEPMVRILATTEEMAGGEVLCALLNREPVFLLPELARRGHAWRGAFDADGRTYRLLVRIGAAGMSS